MDFATVSEINPASAVSEDLVLASADKNVDTLKHWYRAMKKLGNEQQMMGWVLDEADAYHKIGVNVAHSKYSVISIKNPELGQ